MIRALSRWLACGVQITRPDIPSWLRRWSGAVSIGGAAIAFSGAIYGGVPAEAGTIDARPNEGLFFQAAAGEANNLLITQAGGLYTVVDSAPLTALGACVSTGLSSATCPAGEPWIRGWHVSVDLGDLDDSADVTAAPGGSILGGEGADVVSATSQGSRFRFGFSVEGGAGADTLVNDDGDAMLRGQGDNDTLVGRGSNPKTLMVGGPGDDAVENYDGNATVRGRGGDDTLENNGPGNATLRGEGGNDTLVSRGVGGETFMVGGLGADTFSLGPGSTTVSYRSREAASPVTVDADGIADDGAAGEGDNLLPGKGSSAGIWGGAGPDYLAVGGGIGELKGFAGDDHLDARFEVASPKPNRGARMMGGTGDDDIQGGMGGNVILGGAGADWINAHAGVDRVGGREGVDNIYGGGGDDSLYGGRGGDLMFGGVGDDLLEGGNGPDFMGGNWGNDIIRGQRGHDEAFGLHGSDLLDMRDGFRDPTVDGGAGRDRASIDPGLDRGVTSIERLLVGRTL